MSARDESNILPADLKDYGESEDLRHHKAEYDFMWLEDCAGTGLLCVFALALIFWPWL